MSTTTARTATARAGGSDVGQGAGSVLRPLGPHLVIAPAGDGAHLAEALRALSPMPGALLVLAAAPDAAPVLRRELPALARPTAERHATTLVLAASGLAAAAPDGGRPSAHVARAMGLPGVFLSRRHAHGPKHLAEPRISPPPGLKRGGQV